MTDKTFALLGIVVLCVTSPNSVSARYISDDNYLSLSCQELASEAARVNKALQQAIQRQSAFLSPLGGGSLTGQFLVWEIDRYFGERDVIDRVRDQKNC